LEGVHATGLFGVALGDGTLLERKSPSECTGEDPAVPVVTDKAVLKAAGEALRVTDELDKERIGAL
jgi:hypothetical protein